MGQILDAAQEISQETVGAIAVGVGTSATLIQAITEWSNVIVSVGNAVLIIVGLLAIVKSKSKRRDRRGDDDHE